MKMFKMNKQFTIVCEWENTRYGFRHMATLLNHGREIETAKACYYNRTWECYEYQSVILNIIEKTKVLTDKEKTSFTKKARKSIQGDF